MRETIFISFNHKDDQWRQELSDALSAYMYSDDLVWSDDRIETASDWEQQIEKAIAEARVAMLIITPSFFRSKYIASKELIAILDQHSRRGLDIWPIPFKKTMPAEREFHGLQTIQWPRSPEQPLAELLDEERALALQQICADLVRSIGLIGSTSRAARDTFTQCLAASLGSEFSDPVAIAPGDLSIVYKAEWKTRGFPVAIKAILPSMQRPWVADDFAQLADACTKLRDSRFMVRTYETIRDEKRNLRCAVMECLDKADTLDTLLRRSRGGLEPKFVAGVLAQLCYAASELHTGNLGGKTDPLLLGPLRPKNVFAIDGEVRVSPLHISHATLPSCRGRPMVVLDDQALTYITPEQFFGDAPTPASDQYYIALLGVELLRGEPIDEVSRFADLLRKRTFFDAPAAALQDIRDKAPALFFVLTRMLEPGPESRWPDARIAGVALAKISEGGIPEEIRREALESYAENLKTQLKFYRRFYTILFEKHPAIEAMFEKKKTMTRQNKKLRRALVELLYFAPGIEPTTLTELREHEKHRSLTHEHYRAFKEAFLEALAKENPPPSHYTDAAWRAVFDAGIAYMTGAGGSAAHASVAEAKTGTNLLSRARSPRIVRLSKRNALQQPAPLGARPARRADRSGPGTEGRRP